MSENQIPATQPEPDEFNFTRPATENPRIKRRSLKTKRADLSKLSCSAPLAARELEREAPPLSTEEAVQPRDISAVAVARDVSLPNSGKLQEVTREAPPLGTSAATTETASPSQSASNGTTARIASTASPTISPHGTRPATLYYSSHPRKAETPSPMKTIPTTSTAPSSSATATTPPSSVARSTTTPSRPATTLDYRANVERQSREQKSVGNILNYVVYALIGFFIVSAGLAGYGADVIFAKLRDQGQTVSDLDQKYAKATGDLTTKLAATQDALDQAQAQIGRQQDLILKQQEEINRLIVATNDNTSALKTERQTRAGETVNLRAQVKDLQNRGTYQKY